MRFPFFHRRHLKNRTSGKWLTFWLVLDGLASKNTKTYFKITISRTKITKGGLSRGTAPSPSPDAARKTSSFSLSCKATSRTFECDTLSTSATHISLPLFSLYIPSDILQCFKIDFNRLFTILLMPI